MPMYSLINHGPTFGYDAGNETVYVWDAAPAAAAAETGGRSALGKVHVATGEIEFVNATSNVQVADLLFVEHCESVELAVEEAIQRHGPDATIAVIPKGPYVLSQLASG